MSQSQGDVQERPLAKLIIFLIAFPILFFGFNWWTNHKVSTDAIDKYEIALRNGDKSTACFQAGVAAASYLSAKNEAAYLNWRVTEFKACGNRIPDECLKRYDLSSTRGGELPRSEFCRRINP